MKTVFMITGLRLAFAVATLCFTCSATKVVAQTRADLFKLDKNVDGAVSEKEAGSDLWKRLKALDANEDGIVTRSEFQKRGPSRRRSSQTEQRFAKPENARVPYGPNSRQWLNLYLADSDKPAPVFFYAHANGSTAFTIKQYEVDRLTGDGFTIVSWESIATVRTAQELATTWKDATDAFEWVKKNAAKYNLDTENIIVGGRSRGTGASWKLAHSGNRSIKGLYMMEAMGDQFWTDASMFDPLAEITATSPPIVMPYWREPGTSDTHDPEHGAKIVQRYRELGKGNQAKVEHSLRDRSNGDRFQFFRPFAMSVMK